jgi:hypothetical protein
MLSVQNVPNHYGVKIIHLWFVQNVKVLSKMSTVFMIGIQKLSVQGVMYHLKLFHKLSSNQVAAVGLRFAPPLRPHDVVAEGKENIEKHRGET